MHIRTTHFNNFRRHIRCSCMSDHIKAQSLLVEVQSLHQVMWDHLMCWRLSTELLINLLYYLLQPRSIMCFMFLFLNLIIQMCFISQTGMPCRFRIWGWWQQSPLLSLINILSEYVTQMSYSTRSSGTNFQLIVLLGRMLRICIDLFLIFFHRYILSF